MLGSCIAAAVFSNFAQLMNKNDAASARYQEQLQKIHELDKLYKLPAKSRRALLEYHELIFSAYNGFDIQDIVHNFPVHLQGRIFYLIHKDFLLQVPMFRECESGFIQQLALQVSTQVVLAGDFVFHRNDLGELMYFVKIGVIQIGNADLSVVYVTKAANTYFGEIAVFSNSRRTASARATTDSIMYTLSKTGFETVAIRFPESYDKVYKVSEQLLQQVKVANSQSDRTSARGLGVSEELLHGGQTPGKDVEYGKGLSLTDVRTSPFSAPPRPPPSSVPPSPPHEPSALKPAPPPKPVPPTPTTCDEMAVDLEKASFQKAAGTSAKGTSANDHLKSCDVHGLEHGERRPSHELGERRPTRERRPSRERPSREQRPSRERVERLIASLKSSPRALLKSSPGALSPLLSPQPMQLPGSLGSCAAANSGAFKPRCPNRLTMVHANTLASMPPASLTPLYSQQAVAMLNEAVLPAVDNINQVVANLSTELLPIMNSTRQHVADIARHLQRLEPRSARGYEA